MQRNTVATYSAAGFGAQTPRGTHPAVVVVDFTRGFTQPRYPTGSDMSDAISSTNAVIRTAREGGFPVIFTRIAFTNDHDGRAWRAKAPGISALREGSEESTFDSRLDHVDSDLDVVKFGASAFFETPMRSLLRASHADTLIVCGATTSGCVRATAVDAVQCGFGVLVPSDCVADRADEPHQAALFDLEQKYADVIDSATAVEYLKLCAAGEGPGPGA